VMFASARRRLVLIRTDISEDHVTLTAPGLPQLTLPLPLTPADVNLTSVLLNDHPDSGADLGPDAARWLGEFFDDGKAYSLIYFLPEAVKPRRTVELPRLYASLGQPDDIISYNFVSPMSILCSSSLDELNSRLETPVSLANFRHNLIIDEAPAFDDDNWSFVRIGGAVMRYVKPVHRCIFTTADPQTGERSAQMEPLKTLRKFRPPRTAEEKRMYNQQPLFGSLLGVEEEGEVAVGEVVYVMRR